MRTTRICLLSVFAPRTGAWSTPTGHLAASRRVARKTPRTRRSPEELEVVATHHGPIIAGRPHAGTGLAFSHTGTNSGTPWADSVYQLLTARSADEAEEAMREWTEPVNNVVYADVHGAYGYRYRGRIPLRPLANGWAPVPGWTGEYEWTGQIPFEAMPQTRNPSVGYAVTCNQRVTTAEYPYYINTYFVADYRAGASPRGCNLCPLGQRQSRTWRLSMLSGCQFQHRRSCTYCPGAASRPTVAAARELLLAWDGSMDRTSVAATLYGTAKTYWLADVLQHALGRFAKNALASSGIGRGASTHAVQLYARAVTAMVSDTTLLPPGRTWPGLVELALGRAVTELRQRLGDDMHTWTWGKVHHTRPRHPLSRVFSELAPLLDPPQVAAGGDGDTPQQGGYWGPDRFRPGVVVGEPLY